MLTEYTRTGTIIDDVPAVVLVNKTSGGYDQGPVYTIETLLHFGAAERERYLDSGAVFSQIQSSTIDRNTGLPLSYADASGAKTFFVYDALGRPTKVTPPASTEAPTIDPPSVLKSTPQIYSYRLATAGRIGNECSTSYPADCQRPSNATGSVRDCTGTLNISRVNGGEMSYSYDLFGRPALTEESLPGSATKKTQTFYSVTGLSLREFISNPVGGALNVATRHLYDAQNREVKTIQPDNRTVEYQYQGTRSTTKVYKVGNSAVNALPAEIRDGFGRLRRANDTIVRADYTYDAQDHLVRTDLVAGDTTQSRFWTYDGRGFLVSQTQPELGPGTIKHTRYDALGHARDLSYPSKAEFNLAYSFDLAGRLTSVLSTPPSTTVSERDREILRFVFNPPSAPAGSRGQVSTAVRLNLVPDPAGSGNVLPVPVTQKFGYDFAGHSNSVSVEANYGSCFTAKATYGYDGLGQLTTIDYPSLGVSAPSNQPTRQVLRTYEDGRLSKIGTAANVKAFAVLGYHANGMLSSIARERGAATFTDNILPDSAGMPRPGGYTWQYLAGTPGTGEYKYDDVGNLYKIGNDSYGYDNASRLTKATLDGQIRTYAYDAFGNMSQWVDPSGVTHDTKTVAATNRLSETTGATYNERGDLTALSDRRPLALFPGAPAVPLKFQWDALSALTRVDGNGIGRVFLYDADGQRVATLDFKAPGDPSQIHEHWSFRGIDNTVLRDFDRTAGVWSWTKDYVYAGPTLISTVGASEAIRDVHSDHLGTTRFITDTAGRPIILAVTPEGLNIRDTPRKYWPFGQPTVGRPLGERMAFTGHERDDDGTNYTDADLDYMHARYYSSEFGRFLSIDPAQRYALESPQAWNRYAYVRNNPTKLVDPTGAVEAAPGAQQGQSAPTDDDIFTFDFLFPYYGFQVGPVEASVAWQLLSHEEEGRSEDGWCYDCTWTSVSKREINVGLSFFGFGAGYANEKVSENTLVHTRDFHSTDTVRTLSSHSGVYLGPSLTKSHVTLVGTTAAATGNSSPTLSLGGGFYFGGRINVNLQPLVNKLDGTKTVQETCGSCSIQ